MALDINQLTGQIVDAAMKVHRALGPGLLESANEACLLHELRRRGIAAVSQVPLPVTYEGVKLDVGYRVDLLVADAVIVELKAVDAVLPIHKAQVISYSKLSGKTVALLLNFNVLHLKDGISRFANGEVISHA
jgi:GxxExxY protein